MKQKAYAGGQPEPSVEDRKRRTGSGEAARQIAQVAVGVVLGLIIPRASVYGGMMPFGVGMAAAVSGPGAILVYLATMIGYILPLGEVFPLRYLAAVAAVGGIRWVLSSLPGMGKKAALPSILAFLATVVTGLAMSAGGGLDMYKGLIIFAESLIAGGFAYFFGSAVRLFEEAERPSVLSAQQQASLILTGAVALMAISTLQFAGISPGRMVAVVLVLLLARCGKEQGGAIAGIVLGVAMALASPSHLVLAAAYAFGGLIGGIFSRFGKFATAGAFVVSNVIVYMMTATDLQVVISIYEVLAGSVLFVALPRGAEKRVNRFFLRGRDIPAVEGLRRSMVMKLEYASRAMGEVASTVDEVSKKLAGLSAPDLGSVYRGVSDSVCRVCGLRMYCWESCFSDTMAAFNDLTPSLREKGQISPEQIGGHLQRHCGRLDEITRKINAGYAEHLIREGAWRRLSEIRTVITDQFAGMAELLDELSDKCAGSQQVDTEAAARVIAVCEDHGFLVEDAVCFIGRNGRMTVEILADDAGVSLRQGRWFRDMCEACGKEFDQPVAARMGNGVRITLTERPVFRLEVGSAQLACTNERLCGDAFETFSDGNGRMITVLSDGMGSGGRAAVDGAMAAGLTTRLLKAGFGEDSVLRLVNSALMVKSGDESLATLDIAGIDLFTGRMESWKAGAATSLLCSLGRVSRIERASLPAGILQDIHFEKSADTLVDGDILLLLSDGVISDGIAWVEEMVGNFDPASGGMKRLAEEIAMAARKRQQGQREDDVTVVAMQLHRAERQSQAAKRRHA